MNITINPDVELSVTRCWNCGRRWAIETFARFDNLECPQCAGDAVRKAEERAATAERSAAALRGVIKRMKAVRRG